MSALREQGEARRDDIVAFVAAYWLHHRHAPSLQEIGDAVGLRAVSVVHRHVTILVEADMLLRDRGVQRTIRLGPAALGSPP